MSVSDTPALGSSCLRSVVRLSALEKASNQDAVVRFENSTTLAACVCDVIGLVYGVVYDVWCTA